MRKSKVASLKALVVTIIVLIGIVTSFFSALTVYEQLNIHPFLNVFIAALAGLGTALFQAALIGFSRFIRGVPLVKGVMLVAGIVLTTITIFGVYSGLQSSFFRNVVESGNYQRLSKQSETLQKKLDRQIELDHVTKSESTARQLQETNRALSEAEKSGSGSARNQWATNLSNVFGVDTGAVSFGRHTIIGLAIDLSYYLALWFLFYGLLFREKTPLSDVLPIEDSYLDYDEDYRSWQRGNGKQVETSSNGKTEKKAEKAALSEEEKMEMRLREFLRRKGEDHWDLAEAASAIGAPSGQTVRRLLDKIGYAPQYAQQGARHNTNSVDYSPTLPEPQEQAKQPYYGFTQPGYTAQGDNPGQSDPEVIHTQTHTSEKYYLTDDDRKKAEALKESRRNYIKGLVLEYCKENPGHGGRKIANYVNSQLANIPLKNRRGKRLKNTITHTTALTIKRELQAESKL